MHNPNNSLRTLCGTGLHRHSIRTKYNPSHESGRISNLFPGPYQQRAPGNTMSDDSSHSMHRREEFDDLSFRQRKINEKQNVDKVQHHKRKIKHQWEGGQLSLTIVLCEPDHCSLHCRPATPELVFPTSPPFVFDMSRESSIAIYTAWQRRQSKTDDQRSYYDMMENLTIANGYTLDMIALNPKRMSQFYEDHGVPQGFAWNYVSYVPWFAEILEGAEPGDKYVS